ncbi:dihydrolipoyl dehydrogenase family protein [Nitrosococcus watsonii]|uniref:FAD-dependent pyridine nucleotide-disulfide oxidoreductase n=1 Tax=Nitrosococcus watsoni (strain C-113) TaxID=105559 RepID=D8K7M7_NITWC|nr:FAD-dependent oxidoreductase [Nitrosococcus watsonii]ADJ28904.1 FAD-dependent pyridine nucleotide-disulfide oxidoreductase [Nitrosococcus watsonii C-113]
MTPVSTKNNFDVLVLGGGTAGTNAAQAACNAGASRVGVVYIPEMFNTCVQEGCMPSKSVLASSAQGHSFLEAIYRKDVHLSRLARALKGKMQRAPYTLIEGKARFLPEAGVEVTQGEKTRRLWAKNYVIATGSHAWIPPIKGLEDLPAGRMLVSDDIVGIQTLLGEAPKRLLVLGGGPIGLELATFFARLGTEVLILDTSGLLGPFDSEFGQARLRALKTTPHMDSLVPGELQSVTDTASGLLCRIAHQGTLLERYADRLLIATGRKPNIEALALENADVQVEGSTIEHNEYLQTSNPHIYIAGDVINHHQILHYAAEMGQIAGANAARGKPTAAMDYQKFSLAITFDEYPSALIGLTEKEAKAQGYDVISATQDLSSLGMGILEDLRWGLWKLVADRKDGRVLGSQIFGPSSAPEIIQLLSPILYYQGTLKDIVRMTWYHPTYAELLRSLARKLCSETGIECPGA